MLLNELKEIKQNFIIEGSLGYAIDDLDVYFQSEEGGIFIGCNGSYFNSEWDEINPPQWLKDTLDKAWSNCFGSDSFDPDPELTKINSEVY